MINKLENMFLNIDDEDEEYSVSNSDVIEALIQRRQDIVYKERMRNALINAVREKKTSIVRQVVEMMYLQEFDTRDVVIFYRELIKDGTTVDSQVQKFIKQYEESFSFDPYII